MWYLVEVIGFVATAFCLPCRCEAESIFVRWAPAWTVLRCCSEPAEYFCDRLQLPADLGRYVSRPDEIGTSVFIVTLGIVIYRFISFWICGAA